MRLIISSALQRDEQRFLIIDADDYFYKSDDLSILIEKVDKAINNKHPEISQRKNERRASKRTPVSVLATFERIGRFPQAPISHILSYSKDLSEEGGRFIVGEDVKIGQNITVALELPVNFLPILIDGEVVWVKKIDEYEADIPATAEVGIRFVKLDLPGDEEKLKNYLKCS